MDHICSQNSVTPVPQSDLAPAMCTDPVSFKLLRQIWLSRSTYKMTSYVDFAPYLNTFRQFETYLQNFTVN